MRNYFELAMSNVQCAIMNAIFEVIAGGVVKVIVGEYLVLQTDLFASNDAHYFNSKCGMRNAELF